MAKIDEGLMQERILITGITGLIGGAVLDAILALPQQYDITALVRPGTVKQRYAAVADKIKIVEQDLADIAGLRKFLESGKFDVVMHIGALRGGRSFSREVFYRANLMATEQFCQYCQKEGARLLFCSSVGVYGAIPKELPAQELSPRNPDNCYHYTKIQSEKAIQKAVLYGLKAAILRPAITYGAGDRGFPFQLVKMVDKRIFPLVNKRIWIHLCHIQLITQAFIWLLQNDWQPGLALNVADREPVQLQALVHFISRQLRGSNYPKMLSVDLGLLHLGERMARIAHNELWISRFELISHSWFYEVRSTFETMDLAPIFTIPAFQNVIDYYQK